MRRLIKKRDNSGLGFVEIIFSAGILVITLLLVISASIMLRGVCYTSIAQHNLQRDANILMTYIVRRAPGEASYNSLRSAASYSIPTVSPAGSAIIFTDKNGTERRYYQQGNSVIYRSPTLPFGSQTKTIYSAPANGAIKLQFMPASMDGETVRVYIAITQDIAGKTISGNLSVCINLRNCPK